MLTKGILLIGNFISEVLNNPLTCCSLINFDFLLSHTSHFDKSIILSFFVFRFFYFLCFFYPSDNRIKLFHK